MIHERKPIELCKNPLTNACFGHINLHYLADPQTVKVSLNGQNLKPLNFNIFGEPIFSEEMYLLYQWKSNQITRKKENKNYVFLADVYYDVLDFQVPTEVFNSISGLKDSVKDLSTFRKILDYRKIYRKVFMDTVELNEFVVFGKYLLDSKGDILPLTKPKNISAPIVCTKTSFSESIGLNFDSSIDAYIPTETCICPCCGKQFNINDLKSNSFLRVLNGKITHAECFKNFYHDKAINEIVSLVNSVYPNFSSFNCLCNEDCDYIPSLLFYTSDGTILINCSKDVKTLSIQWQKGFEDFNIDIIFNEELSKWNDERGFGIKDISFKQAYNYLQKIKTLKNHK